MAAVGGTAWLFRDYDPQTGLGCGEYIVIDDPSGHKSRYCHLKDRVVAAGRSLPESTDRARSDRRYGNHLHLIQGR
jgi:hypothetical protein